MRARVEALARDYLSRHRNPWNRAVHVVGIPLAPIGCTVLAARGRFRAAGRAFVAGYGLQWIGHRIEGNEVGEWILVKKVARRLAGPR